MAASTAQFQFAAEFVSFLAAAAGLALVVLRAEIMGAARAAKVLIGAGFAALGAAAFIHGSQIVTDAGNSTVLGLRLAGVAAVGLGSLSWQGSRTARRVLWAGALLTAVSVALARSGEDVVASSLLAVGGIAFGVSLLSVSRRSIAARVAASAAGTLLLVVLVLSVALSTVLASTVRDEAVRRLDARARTEVSLVESSEADAVTGTRLAASALPNSREDEVLRLAAHPEHSPQLDVDLKQVSQQYLSDLPLGYVSSPVGTVLASYKLDVSTLVALAGSSVVEEVASGKQEATSIVIVGGQALSVAAHAVIAPPTGNPRVVGIVIGVVRLDDAYLEGRAFDDRTLSLAIVGRDHVLSSYRGQPATGELEGIARDVMDSGRPLARATGGRFVVAQLITTSDDRPIAALVASSPTTIVNQTRERLFRTLFLIALGGTMIALVLAAFVGDRIGSGIRRLTTAAEGIQRGQLDVRAGIGTDDEVGVLGAAFDSMVASLQETTEAETRLRTRLEAVVAGMGEALVAVDADGMVTDFNQAAEELVGVRASAARGLPIDEVVHLVGDDGTDLAERLRRPAPGRATHQGFLERADGGRVPVALSSGTLREPGTGTAGTVFVVRDLRREREVERMKTEFLSRVGHELRTPLTGIIGYADLLARKDVPATRARQWHAEILEQSKRLLRIVEMLEFTSASAANRVYMRPERIDLRSVVEDVVRRKGDEVVAPHTLVKRVARGLPPVVADRRLLGLALDELVDNAVKFSPKGGRVIVAAALDGGDRVELSVTDRGKGMTEAEQEQAFADFVQGDASDTRRFGGLGLGLALVKEVAEAHGGEVACQSQPGKGSKFSVLLPALPIESRR